MKHYHLPPLKITFAENAPEKIQIMRVGTFYDDRYGKIEITSAHLISMQENFEKKVRGVDIALDFSHKSDGPAAGWIKKLTMSQDGQELWAEIDWTNAGKENLLGKEYRYVSPDFTFSYKDNETLQEFGAVLLGAGLTNRPVIKSMAPAISLQEHKYQEGEPMTPEEIAAMKAENESLKAELAKLKAPGGAPKLPDETKPKEDGGDAMDMELMKKNSEQAAKILALENQCKEKDAKIEMAEKSKKFDVMLSEGKCVEAQRDAFLKGDMTEFLSKAMPIKLTEIGTGGGTGSDKDKDKNLSASDRVMKLAEAHTAKGKTTGEAIRMVLNENKELREEYQKEVAV